MICFVAELPISSDALGLIIAGLIFLVTVTLIAKKLINFLITIVLLFFAIASGMAIAHNDLVREYFKKEKMPYHDQNGEDNFLEPLRAEVMQLLNRVMELLRTHPEATKNLSIPRENPGETQQLPLKAPASATPAPGSVPAASTEIKR